MRVPERTVDRRPNQPTRRSFLTLAANAALTALGATAAESVQRLLEDGAPVIGAEANPSSDALSDLKEGESILERELVTAVDGNRATFFLHCDRQAQRLVLRINDSDEETYVFDDVPTKLGSLNPYDYVTAFTMGTAAPRNMPRSMSVSMTFPSAPRRSRGNRGIAVQSVTTVDDVGNLLRALLKESRHVSRHAVWGETGGAPRMLRTLMAPGGKRACVTLVFQRIERDSAEAVATLERISTQIERQKTRSLSVSLLRDSHAQ